MEYESTRTAKHRTRREFPFGGDIWGLVDAWAEQNGFRLIETQNRRRLYRKGVFLMMAPGLVEITHDENRRVVVQAWVKADPYLVLALLGGKRPEMAIDSGGLTASIPRRKTRDAVNVLLKAFNQPEIK